MGLHPLSESRRPSPASLASKRQGSAREDLAVESANFHPHLLAQQEQSCESLVLGERPLLKGSPELEGPVAFAGTILQTLSKQALLGVHLSRLYYAPVLQDLELC